jgi:ribosomal protein S8E
MHTKIFTLFILLTVSCLAKSQEYSTPGEYLKFLSKTTEVVRTEMKDYCTAVALYGKQIEKEAQRKAIVEKLNTAVKNVETSVALPKTDYIKEAYLEFITLNQKILDVDYFNLITLEQNSVIDQAAYEKYVREKMRLNDRKRETNTNLRDQINRYIEENKLEGYGDIKDEWKIVVYRTWALDHYNPLSLVYTKIQNSEGHFLFALGQNNISEAKMARGEMIKTMGQAEAAVTKIKVFDNDSTLLNEINAAMTFYKKEAEVDFVELIATKENPSNTQMVDKDLISKTKKNSKRRKKCNCNDNSLTTAERNLAEKRAAINTEWNKKANAYLKKYLL